MHYNRWSWAIAFTALAIALLPSMRAPRPIIDGLLVGALMAALALTKLTFFLGLAPVVTVAILWPFNLSRALAALAGGLAVAAYVSVVYGMGFLPAYLGDLLSVAGGDIRKFPGEPIEELIGGSPWVGGSLAAVALLFVLNRVGETRLAMLLILLLPALIYITWQNYGNDPIWLMFLGLLGFAARPAFGETEAPGGDGRVVLTVVSAVLVALTFPSMFHIATSPLRHYTMPEAKYEPVLPNLEGHQDWLITTDRARTMDATLWLDQEGSVWFPQAERVGREERPAIGDTVFPYCEFNAGTVAWFQEISEDLLGAGVPEGSQFLTIDIVSALWLAGPFEPLKDGAPWYYGELNGIENAEYVLVPRCTFVESARTQMIADVNDSGVPLELVRENELYWLFATPQAPQVAIAR